MNPTTPLHEDTLTYEMNPTTPLHEDTLTFEMNPTTPLHEDTLNDIPPDHHPIIYLTKMFHNAIQMNQVHEMELINYLYCYTLKNKLGFLHL